MVRQWVSHLFIHSFLSDTEIWWVPTGDATFSEKKSQADLNAYSPSLFWLILSAQERRQIKATWCLEMLGRAHCCICDSLNSRKFAQLLPNTDNNLDVAEKDSRFPNEGKCGLQKERQEVFWKVKLNFLCILLLQSWGNSGTVQPGSELRANL